MRHISIRKLMLLIAVTAVCCALVFRPERITESPHSFCMSNLKNIVLCLEAYRLRENAFPNGTLPASSPRVVDRLSFYVPLAPYFDEQDLYDHVRPTEPWNSPSNLEVACERVYLLNCRRSSCLPPKMPQQTNYIGIAGLGVDARVAENRPQGGRFRE